MPDHYFKVRAQVFKKAKLFSSIEVTRIFKVHYHTSTPPFHVLSQCSVWVVQSEDETYIETPFASQKMSASQALRLSQTLAFANEIAMRNEPHWRTYMWNRAKDKRCKKLRSHK